MKRNGVWQLNLPTPQQMTFDHSYFVAFHMFQGPGRWLREQGVDPRWRTYSPDHAQFYEDHFHNHLGRLPGFLVFDESNPANRRNDLQLTDWMAMVLSGGMNPHRHYQPATPNRRKSSPSLVEPRVVCIVRAELAQENNPDDVTVHFLIHPPTGTILPDKSGQFHRVGNKNRENMKMSLAQAVTDDNIKKKQKAMG